MKKIFSLFVIVILLHSVCIATTISKEQIKNRIETVKQIREKVKAFAPKKTTQKNLKSVSAKQKMLDKISYPDGSYKTFAYNDTGLLIDYKNYLYDDWDEKMELQEHQEMEYDADGNRTLFIDRNLDSFDGFIIIEKEEATYQANHIPKEEIRWNCNDTDKGPIKTGKSVYTLTDATNLTSEKYSWNSETEDWKLSGKTEYNFSDFEHPNSVSTYYWDNSTEEFYLQEVLEFNYNDQGLVTETIEKFVSEDTGELTVGLTITTTYNSEGNILNETAGGTFMGENVIVYKNIYTYENGLLTVNEYKSTWGGTKTEYSYTNGKLSEKREFYPDFDENGIDQGLILQYRDQFVYDSKISIEELAYPSTLDKYYHAFADFCDPFYFQYGAIENTICFGWDYVTEDVIEKYRGTYHYSDFKAGMQEETAIHQISETNLKVGPNPCNESLNISVSGAQSLTVKVHNISGQLVYNSTLQGQNVINTESWEKGNYILSAQSDKGVNQTIKLIRK